jgi:hypothetical protein
MSKADIDRALELAGEAKTLAEALDQWEREREAIADLMDENQALVIHHMQLTVALAEAADVVEQVEKEASMFLTQKTRNRIQQYRNLLNEQEKRRAEVKQLIADRKEQQHE